MRKEDVKYDCSYFEGHIPCKPNKKFNAQCDNCSYYEKDSSSIINLDSNDKILGVEEKPDNPKSNQAITGLYIFDNNVSKYSKSLRPSNRGETEIVDLIQIYIEKKTITR